MFSYVQTTRKSLEADQKGFERVRSTYTLLQLIITLTRVVGELPSHLERGFSGE